MDQDNKEDRDSAYAGYNMGGSVNWAVDLAGFLDVSSDAYQEDGDGSHILLETWSAVIDSVDQGTDPFVHGDRNGNWTNLTCSDPAVQGALDIAANIRWSMLDSDDAWADAVQVYKDYYPDYYFTTAISLLESLEELHGNGEQGSFQRLGQHNHPLDKDDERRQVD